MKSEERARTLFGVVVVVVFVFKVVSESGALSTGSKFDAGSTTVGIGLLVVLGSCGSSISETAFRRFAPLSSIEWRNRRSSLHS